MGSEDELYQAMKMIVDESRPDVEKAMEAIIKGVTEQNMLPRDAIGMDPATIEGLYSQAYQHYNTGHYKEAARLFHMLQLLDGVEPKYPIGLGACYHMMEDYGNAITVYGMVTIIDPENPVPHYHASDCYLKMQLSAAAVGELEMAVELCGDKPEFATMKSRAQLMIRSIQEKGTAGTGPQAPSMAEPLS
jgi:type III secretion system low calcium response chaperone LcrH/SycD